ncbi:MAG TPA: YIP1 family protein, partial [Acidobacteriota bacterium]|nr:YIP1 family protein [Acidobacteriota bacterium]
MTDTPQVPSYGVPGDPGPKVSYPAAEPPKMTTWQRMANIFLSPGEVFEDINRKPDFILPLILTTVLSLGFYLIVNWQLKLDPRETAKAAIEKQLEQQGKRMRDLSEKEREAYEQGIEVSVKIQKYAFILVLIIVPLAITFFSGIYYIGSLLIRGQTSFVKV